MVRLTFGGGGVPAAVEVADGEVAAGEHVAGLAAVHDDVPVRVVPKVSLLFHRLSSERRHFRWVGAYSGGKMQNGGRGRRDEGGFVGGGGVRGGEEAASGDVRWWAGDHCQTNEYTIRQRQ